MARRTVAGSLCVAFALLFVGPAPRGVEAQTLRLTATLTLDKDDDKAKTLQGVNDLIAYSKEKKLEGNIIRFLENSAQQLVKVMDAAKVVEEQKSKEVPKEFTPTKYRVKSMPKLQTKKTTVKKISAVEFQKKLAKGEALSFKEPMIVTNATSLFSNEGGWDEVRRYWHASRISEDEYLEKELRLEYWPPEKAKARLVGNYLVQEDPEMVAFSRYLVICFHGTPAKPKLPGQNTEHCEQTAEALSMAHNASELDTFNLFPQMKNALPLQSEFRKKLLAAAGSELSAIVGKGVEKWKKRTGNSFYRFFVFGPSGSGDKLHAENGLPFFDVLVHGSRRWLLLKEDEMERVAVKAREALEFDKTSAYMFFEEKLPELREEFGLKKYVECNQQAGDLVFVPSGWYRVSLSLADSFSYYETMLTDKNLFRTVVENQIWRPHANNYKLAYCYGSKNLDDVPGIRQQLGQQQLDWLRKGLAKLSTEDTVLGIFDVLLSCGSVWAIGHASPNLDISKDSQCTPKVWSTCRGALQEILTERGEKAKLDWLPKKIDEFKGLYKVGQKDEL